VLGMLKAMRTTLRHLPMKKVTEQYPEQRAELPDRSRGLFKVVAEPANDGVARCRACTLCETNCPVQVIRVNYTSTYQLPAVSEARIAEVRVAVQPTFDAALVDKVVDEHYFGQGASMVAVLQEMQDAFGFLPRLALQQVSARTGVSLSELYGLATFHPQFLLAPLGKYVIDVCTGTACRVAGAAQVIEAFEEEMRVRCGETSDDGLFTLQAATCMGACALAPVIRMGEDMRAQLTADAARALVAELRAAETVGVAAGEAGTSAAGTNGGGS
jgi:NADH-quinone oxidoreductase subunit E